MAFKIVRNDITKMDTEAIVNTANEQPEVGSGCDHAIYTAAGFDDLLSYRKEKIGYVPEGEVFITPGFRLPAKYIIHAVSPLFQGGDQGEEEKLRSCYRKSLQLASEKEIRSIAFPLIATGGFEYPKEEGMRIAIDEISSFLMTHDMEIILVVFGEKATVLGSKIFPDLEEYIDRNYVDRAFEEEYLFEDRSEREEAHYFSRPMESRREPRSKKRRDGRIRERRLFSAKESREDTFGAALADECSAPMGAPCEAMQSFAAERPPKTLDEAVAHISDTFQQSLFRLIDERNLADTEVYKRANIDRKLFSKIRSNPNYQPKKITAVAFALALNLNLDETKDLIGRAGYAFSPSSKFDLIISYFIEQGVYDIYTINLALFDHEQPLLGE